MPEPTATFAGFRYAADQSRWVRVSGGASMPTSLAARSGWRLSTACTTWATRSCSSMSAGTSQSCSSLRRWTPTSSVSTR